MTKFRLKWKELGKTTRPFRYDLNQIPYLYTMEMTNRFKGLDMIDRVLEEPWAEVCDIIQSEVSQKEKDKYHILTYIYGI